MRSTTGLVLALAALGGIAVCFEQGVSAEEPPRLPPALPGAGAYDAARTQAERVANEAAYQEVMGWRHFMLNEHLGEWVAIAGGKGHPVNERGTAVRPSRTMEEAVAAAERAVPGARHRFVFRIGEEGTLEEMLGGAEVPHVLGTGFLMQFERPGIEMRGYGPNQPIHFVKDGVRTELTVKGPDHRMFVRPEVGPPGRAGKADALYVLSTGYGGYTTTSAETAAAASLHLWEIPGTITIKGALREGVCRRARARFRFAGSDIDVVVPVAVWPDAR